MDEFLTDDERAESAKRWLRDNGLFLVAGVVLGLGILFGWQYWEQTKSQRSAEASLLWQQLSSAADGERFNEVDELLGMIETDYSGTPYLDQSRLSIANMHMKRNSPEEALEQLNSVANEGNDASLRRIAELRIAQVYLYLENYDAAFAVLGNEDNSSFAAIFHDLRGDLYFAQGDFEAARDEYRKALDADRFMTIDRSFVQMKLDDVSGSISETVAEVEVTEVEAE